LNAQSLAETGIPSHIIAFIVVPSKQTK